MTSKATSPAGSKIMSKSPSKAAVGGKTNADLQSEDSMPRYGQGTRPKRVAKLNEYEKHEGWHQLCHKEKYTMITSIKKAMELNETYDAGRA